VLRTEHLTKNYRDVRAVDDLSLGVYPGEIFGLIGSNGAGKTTTIAMMLGLVTPSSGFIRVFDLDPARNRAAVLSRMNFSSPYVALPNRLTVEQNLRVYADLYSLRHPGRRIEALCAELELGPLKGHKLSSLSSGQKTQVALAKALLNRPELLLLDEPTASLDPDVADRIRSRLLQYRDSTGASLIITSHNMAEVERVCDRVLILKAGRVAALGTPAEVIARHGLSNLEEVFLDIARNPHKEKSA